ncbi:MAG: hypothetical protein ACQEU4_23115 [Bacillota bacterium]
MGVLRKAIFVKFVDLEKKAVVDFRSRMLAFRGAGGEPPGSHLSSYSRRSRASCSENQLSDHVSSMENNKNKILANNLI